MNVNRLIHHVVFIKPENGQTGEQSQCCKSQVKAFMKYMYLLLSKQQCEWKTLLDEKH